MIHYNSDLTDLIAERKYSFFVIYPVISFKKRKVAGLDRGKEDMKGGFMRFVVCMVNPPARL